MDDLYMSDFLLYPLESTPVRPVPITITTGGKVINDSRPQSRTGQSHRD